MTILHVVSECISFLCYQSDYCIDSTLEQGFGFKAFLLSNRP